MEELNKATDCIIFFVNGRKILLNQPDPEITLLQFLRDHLGLKGTKLGCAEGGCGACTVMVSNYNHKTKTVNHFSVNACLAPLCSVDHMAVTTVEGIGSTRTKIHPVQERIAKAHGSQCGFCTPGIVMSMYTLLRNNVRPTEEEMERAFEGNLCRCTGYRPILDAFRTFCCKGDGGNCACSKGDNTGVIEGPYALFDPTEFQPLDPTQEPIFPPELMISTTPPPLHIKTDQVQWFRPSTLQQLLSIKVKYLEKVRIVAGNSEIGVEVKFKSAHFPVLVSPAQIPEMNVLEETDDGLLIGAACTLSEAEVKMKEICNRLPHHKTRTLVAILEMLRLFAGPQIRNVAVIGGNIVTASPISDLNPILVAAGAVLNITSKNAPQYSRKIDESFFVSYRKTVLKHDEVLVSLVIPWTQEHEFVYGYKQSLRRDDDIAIVNAGMRVVVCEEDRKWKVKEISLVYGGMAPVTKVASKTQSKLIGREWNDSLCDDACSSLIEEMKIPLNAPGGRPEFRCSLNASFFLKFYLTVKNEISCIPHELLSATKPFRKELTKASQGFQNVAGSQPSDDVVGRPLMHLSALQQATGEAIYVDDMPSYKDELHAAIVVSSRPHAEIIDIDISEAAEVEGFVDFISAQDIPDEGSNMTGAGPFGIKDEEVFADRKVTCIGQLVGLVVAKSRPLAQRAAKLVKIEYKDLPAIITIEEAIDAAAFYEPKCHSFTVGDTEAALATADHVLSGEIRVGGQEHFYLETQSVLAVPKDVGELEMFVSTQNAHKTQMLAATAIGVPGNRVVVHAKRLGGGFGGKETRHCIYSTSMAVAANKLQVPLRLMLDRDEDMTTTGTRHPYLGRYKVGFNKDGKLLALDTRFYSNAGNSTDLSLPVMERSAMHCENAYYIPNVKASGYACKTNIPSNTAFRAFGRPQTMYMMECVISIVADVCNFPVHKVREMNLYKEGDMTPGNQLLTDFHLQQSWDELMTKIQYEDRVVAVEEFNKRNQWTKRGIAMIPTKFGVGFPPPLSQGGALVHVYTDGSVLLAHGGVEMGQGLHTKMVQ
ncbi:xanthine dehydrogenase/oxidase-like isoform X2 [Dysidea avara]